MRETFQIQLQKTPQATSDQIKMFVTKIWIAFSYSFYYSVLILAFDLN